MARIEASSFYTTPPDVTRPIQKWPAGAAAPG
jgi:hypothetical protein